MLRAATVFFVLIFGFAASVASAAPCPMPERGGTAAHHPKSKTDCPDHKPDADCEHYVFGDCLDFQQPVTKKENTGSKLSACFERPRFPRVFNGVTNRKKHLPTRTPDSAGRHIYLLTLHILI